MQAALLSLHYLPDVLWFRNYLEHETIWIEKQENFVKSTGRNRCEIGGANGRQMLTIPLQGGRDHHRKYVDVKIAYQANWQDSHWHSIKSAYGSAPYYEFYAHIFQKFYEKQYLFLYDFNLELLNAALGVLKLKKSFELTAEFEKPVMDKVDLRGYRGGLSAAGLPRYYQVFEERHGFAPNLSVLDLIFNMGPESGVYFK